MDGLIELGSVLTTTRGSCYATEACDGPAVRIVVGGVRYRSGPCVDCDHPEDPDRLPDNSDEDRS